MATVSASQFFGGKVPPPPTASAPIQPSSSYGSSVIDAAKEGLNKATEGMSDVANAKNPVELIEASAKEGAGLVEAASAPLAPLFSPIGKLIGYVSDKLSDHPAVQKFAQSPAGEVTSRVAEDVANLDTLAGAAAGSKAGTRAAVATADAGSAAARAAASTGGAALKTAGEKATGLGVTIEVPTRQALQAYQATQPTLFGRVKNLITGTKQVGNAAPPTTEANTAVRLLQPGTEWQLGVHAKAVSQRLWNQTIAPALQKPLTKVNMPAFFANLKRDIIQTTADLDRRNTLLNALESFQEDYRNVGRIGLDKLQTYKEGWAKFVPERAYKGQPIAAALNEVRNLAAQRARKLIYDSVGPEIKQAYIDYGNLKSIEEAGIKSIDALRSKGVTRQVWEAVMDKAVTPIATVAGKILYKTGEGLEFLGKPGANKVRDIVQPR